MSLTNQYSPFNRWKALLHADKLTAIAQGQIPTPYWVSVDPSNQCNNNCIYCNAKTYRQKSPTIMTRSHLLAIADFLHDWNVRSVIIEGGGEPFTNHDTTDFIERIATYDIQYGIISNGVNISHGISNTLAKSASWVGISFDSATPDTYKIMRGVDTFKIVIDNIKYLCMIKGSLDVKLKFLITAYNYKDILPFVRLAKDIGVSGVHIKPVSADGVDGVTLPDIAPYIPEINALLTQAKQYETDDFLIDIVTYKFDESYSKIVRFKTCHCTPLGGVFGADGNFWLCYNMRGRSGFALCQHSPDVNQVRRMWGTNYHRNLISAIEPKNCMRCGLTQYNEIMENCIMQDKLFKNFP